MAIYIPLACPARLESTTNSALMSHGSCSGYAQIEDWLSYLRGTQEEM